MAEGTYRERREARAERLRGWADKREAKADAGLGRAHDLASVIPFGQPILAGHYSQGRDTRYRARIGATMDRALEDGRKADEMRSKAANIEAAAAHAIYSDDEDAIERLELKLAGLEAQRDGIKAYNASCRKGTPDPSLLNDHQRGALPGLVRIGGLRPNGAMPAYATTNLGATIRAAKQRLESLGG